MPAAEWLLAIGWPVAEQKASRVPRFGHRCRQICAARMAASPGSITLRRDEERGSVRWHDDRTESGQGMVAYGLLLGFMAVVALGILTVAYEQINDTVSLVLSAFSS